MSSGFSSLGSSNLNPNIELMRLQKQYNQADGIQNPINNNNLISVNQGMRVDSFNGRQSADCDDGCDDGKISLWNKVKSMGKGVVKSITGMVKGLASPKGLLIAAGCVALCAATGGAATPFLIGAGLGKGLWDVGKGAIRASKATTDAEAKAAWEDIGNGAFEVGISAIALKGSVGAIKNAGGGSFTQGLKTTFNNSKAGSFIQNSGAIDAFKSAKTSGGNLVQASGAAGKEIVKYAIKDNTFSKSLANGDGLLQATKATVIEGRNCLKGALKDSLKAENILDSKKINAVKDFTGNVMEGNKLSYAAQKALSNFDTTDYMRLYIKGMSGDDDSIA